MPGGQKITSAAAALAVLMLSVGAAMLVADPGRAASRAPAREFVFSGAGDYGSWSGFEETLRTLKATGPDFNLALGDLSYGGEPEDAWCDEFHQSFPKVVLIAGNHDVGKAQDIGGNINNFTKYCPFPLDVSIVGVYGKQYYFDYPREQPLMRFILISPDLPFYVDDGEYYDYSAGTPRYLWTRDAIDGARAAGIPWVVVAGHENCIAAGEHGCEIGTDIFNLLLDRKVDLILQGHNHHYERSKQLALGPACDGIALNVYNAGCVVNPGSDGQYTKGAGSVLVIAGTGGRELINFDVTNPFAPYIAAYASQVLGSGTGEAAPASNESVLGKSDAAAHASDVPVLGKGVVAFTVSRDRMTMQTHFNLTYQDQFTVTAPPGAPSFFESLPRNVPLVSPAAVGVEVLVIGLMVSRHRRRRFIAAPSAPRLPLPAATASANGGSLNGKTSVNLRGKRFILDESGALRLED
jgi:hypothetical protein